MLYKFKSIMYIFCIDFLNGNTINSHILIVKTIHVYKIKLHKMDVYAKYAHNVSHNEFTHK